MWAVQRIIELDQASWRLNPIIFQARPNTFDIRLRPGHPSIIHHMELVFHASYPTNYITHWRYSRAYEIEIWLLVHLNIFLCTDKVTIGPDDSSEELGRHQTALGHGELEALLESYIFKLTCHLSCCLANLLIIIVLSLYK